MQKTIYNKKVVALFAQMNDLQSQGWNLDLPNVIGQVVERTGEDIFYAVLEKQEEPRVAGHFLIGNEAASLG
jgi:hypothetical protein